MKKYNCILCDNVYYSRERVREHIKNDHDIKGESKKITRREQMNKRMRIADASPLNSSNGYSISPSLSKSLITQSYTAERIDNERRS